MRLIDADALKELIVSNVYPVADDFNSRDYGMFWTGGIEKAIDEMPSIDAVPQWIPCNEMLPDGRLNKSYLVQDKDGRRAVGTYTNWGWMFGHYMNDPVAWMPLPEPYERKES